ncbi:DUF1214 domain-containing protein [Paraliomyxa miuraensis]|uniref:DUF1214 domain-containing protein n=1 Tax=Paraliomyxa miuraensis TaxID=376150 RepID=UPI00225289C4|nr:DUF1214 domain-containing protein [Paraliomyxa miuraensis]MCX4240703.1 DUF1214 domain-containing protein [Paraliomyxa miuraensis]
MRKGMFAALDAYRRATQWWAERWGPSPDDEAEAEVVSGRAWEEFCDALKAAGASLSFPGTPRTVLDRAEGIRYLSRLTRAGLEAFVEHADPAAPVLHRVVHETVKMGSDNPDNYYLTARLDGRLEYRITGRRNTVHYLGFGTQHGHYGKNGGLPPTGYLEGSQLRMDAEGRFEITLSAREPPQQEDGKEGGNWLPMTEQTGTLIVRQTFLDREREVPAQLEIMCTSEEAVARHLTPRDLVEGLRNTSSLVAGASLLFAKWARDFQEHSNLLPRFDQETSNRAGGDPNIAYYHSHWALPPEHALVIETEPPPCEHWNFQLNNYWMESLDYRHHRIHVNKHTAVRQPDGSVRIVVAHRDPGLPNWIETVGHESGTMCFRWVRAEHHPTPRTRVVTMAELQALRETTSAPTSEVR